MKSMNLPFQLLNLRIQGPNMLPTFSKFSLACVELLIKILVVTFQVLVHDLVFLALTLIVLKPIPLKLP